MSNDFPIPLNWEPGIEKFDRVGLARELGLSSPAALSGPIILNYGPTSRRFHIRVWIGTSTSETYKSGMVDLDTILSLVTDDLRKEILKRVL